MRKSYFCPAIIASAFLLVMTSQALAASVEELERDLRERDKVILELLERVEVLERRAGVKRPVSRPRHSPRDSEKRLQDPSQAPGAVTVEEGTEERALELSLTRDGALLLSPGIIETETRLTYIRREDSSPTFITLGDDVFAGETELNSNNWAADFQLRLGLPWDSQIELGFPYHWRNIEFVNNVNFVPVDKSSDSGSGFGDLRIGLARTLVREGRYHPNLIGRIAWDTDTGQDIENGISLGGGFNELKGSVTAIKRQDPVAFVGELSYEYTFEKNEVQPGSAISSVLGGNIALSPETSLSLFFSAAYQDETEINENPVDGSDRTIGAFQLGGSHLIARGTLLALAGGIGLTDDADDFSISVSLTKRFHASLF